MCVCIYIQREEGKEAIYCDGSYLWVEVLFYGFVFITKDISLLLRNESNILKANILHT